MGALYSLANETTGTSHTRTTTAQPPTHKSFIFLCESNQFHLNSYFFLPLLIAFHFHSRFSYWMNQKDFILPMRVSERRQKSVFGLFPGFRDGIVRIKRPLFACRWNRVERAEKASRCSWWKAPSHPFQGWKFKLFAKRSGKHSSSRERGESNSPKNNALNKRFPVPRHDTSELTRNERMNK